MSLRIARKIARLSQSELAKRSGVDNTLLSKIEHGDRSFSSMRFRDLVAVAATLNVEPAELLAFAAIPDPERNDGSRARRKRRTKPPARALIRDGAKRERSSL